MAIKQSTQSAREASVKKSTAPQQPSQAQALRSALYNLAEQELVKVPVLSMPHVKAPAVDPYLKPESITTQTVTFGDVSLPPIQRGIEPGLGLRGEPKDYSVAVIWVNRRQIDETLREIGRQQPELETVLKIVGRYMSYLDTMRSELGLTTAAAASWLKGDVPNVANALEQLQQARDIVGTWDDEYRLHLR